MNEEHPKYKILFVDDDSFLINMYSMKFTNSGFEVSTAQSSAEALKKLKDGATPDIIVMDVIMPGMDGLELLDHIKKENLAPIATTVMLTNQSDSSDIEKAKSLGVDGYIVKATTIPSEVITQILQIHNNKNNV